MYSRALAAAACRAPVIRRFRQRVDSRRYNGAALLGLRGIVGQSHGSADLALAFRHAPSRARIPASRATTASLERIGEEIGAPRAGRRHGGHQAQASSLHGTRRMTTYARITGTGSYLPQKVLTNRDLEARGRDQRRVDRLAAHRYPRAPRRGRGRKFSSDLALHACAQRAGGRGRTSADIDLMLIATSTPDMVFPFHRQVPAAGEVGRDARGAAFDVQAVCSGFVYALATADAFIRTGMHKRALVIGAEVFSRILDWKDRGTCVLFGDGAGAVVLEASDKPGILSSHLHADGRHAGILNTPGHVSGGAVQGDPTLKMDGGAVFKFAVRVLEDGAREALAANGLAIADVDAYIAHQANVRIISHVAKKLGIASERCIVTVGPARQHLEPRPSRSPSTSPCATGASKARRHRVLLQGVGGGFTWGSVLLLDATDRQ